MAGLIFGSRIPRQGSEPIPGCDRRGPAKCCQRGCARNEGARNPRVFLGKTEPSKDMTKQWHGHREEPWAAAKPTAQGRDHLRNCERVGFGYN